jgi:transcriptional regulator with XRE-family HTH domain
VAHLYRLLGRNIAHFRREAKLTQEALAEKTDYSVDFIGLVERGVNAPTVSRLNDIADALGIEIWRLFYPREGEGSAKKARSIGSRATQKRAGTTSSEHRRESHA